MTAANQSPSLMDLCADGLIPEPSPEAMERVGFDCDAPDSIAAVKLLIGAAMTICERERTSDRESIKVTGLALSDLQGDCNMASAALAYGR